MSRLPISRNNEKLEPIPLSLEERKKILQRLTTRVATGILFVQFNYLDFHSTPDAAWIRNIYILLSFYTELLLKAIFVCDGDYADLSDLDAKLRKQGHNLEEIGRQIRTKTLDYYLIKKISATAAHEYHIETIAGDFFVKDFTDIRYDFLDDRTRTLYGNEHEMFKKQIVAMEGINSLLKTAAWD